MPVILSKKFCQLSDGRYKNSDGNPCLRIAIVNLMPLKQRTEDDFLRIIDRYPSRVAVDFVRMSTHVTKGDDRERINDCYLPADTIDLKKYDGLIVTGAPVELLNFEEIDYWDELTNLMDRADRQKIPSIYICWGAFAALYHLHGVKKIILPSKISGAFIHDVKPHRLTRGIESEITVPQSRNTALDPGTLSCADVEPIITSRFNDYHMLADRHRDALYFLGHWEYNPDTLHMEYTRDMSRGLNPPPPANYYLPGKTGEEYQALWTGPGLVFYTNWLDSLIENKATRNE